MSTLWRGVEPYSTRRTSGDLVFLFVGVCYSIVKELVNTIRIPWIMSMHLCGLLGGLVSFMFRAEGKAHGLALSHRDLFDLGKDFWGRSLAHAIWPKWATLAWAKADFFGAATTTIKALGPDGLNRR